jgi:GTP cyclohydrolase II
MIAQQDFVETKLKTKYAEFNIRVYSDSSGKENLVLWTENLDLEAPCLVRVHSECMTGDTFSSLHCDCGKQLAKSLQLIAEEGGVLIYLRQEGRGIGLFEKMKSYQLQSEGYDTFEANVLLGHQPDQRSYEMVKTMLDDLHIKSIRLLTNNPSKVSDIAKLGIEIVERVPLISRPNKHNKKYLETKVKKFQHFLANSSRHYLYQFHMDTAQNMDLIIEFMKDKKKDPLLKLGAGIYVDHLSLTNEAEIARVEAVLKSCEGQSEITPSIHFSFSKSADVMSDVIETKRIWPSAKRLQLNDIKKLEMSDLKRICELFSVDIPLSDDNFDLISNPHFVDLVKKHKAFIMLDNSKGRGVKESEEVLTSKIDSLLALGLNDIFLCGGFGPDNLDAYFKMRRHYRINFSIDAESRLKTDKKLDVEKVKLYLLQLIRFDDPKQKGIDQTKRFLEEHRRSEWDKVEILEHEFSIHPKVFHAGYFPSTAWFATELCELVKGEASFCEVGCGSGVISCLVALANPKLRLKATDINPFAAENTKLNAEQLGLSSKIEVITGDVLEGIKPSPTFDSIFWALPFGFLDPGTQISLEEAQVFDPGYRAIRKFLKTAQNYLKPNGRLLIGFSTDLGHATLLEELAKECSIKLVKIREKTMKEESEVKFEILEGRFDS